MSPALSQREYLRTQDQFILPVFKVVFTVEDFDGRSEKLIPNTFANDTVFRRDDNANSRMSVASN